MKEVKKKTQKKNNGFNYKEMKNYEEEKKNYNY